MKKTDRNRQRVLWMVLITSLAAPFFAGMLAVAIVLAGRLAGVALLAATDVALGEVGLKAFAWSALPSTLAALALTPFVFDTGTYSWLQAAVAGVVAFGAAAVIAPFNGGAAMPLLAFLAGIIAIVMRDILIKAKILRP